jgi:hypothetical protein
VRSRALEAPRPCRSKRRFDPPLASRIGCEQLIHDAPHQKPRPHHSRSVENARAGTKVAAKGGPRRGGRLRRVMRRTFRRITHFSKNEHPSSTSLSGPRCFRPRAGECRASWRFTRFGLPWSAWEAAFLFRLRARTGFPLTPHFGSLPAGPHERCRHCGDPRRLPPVSRHFSRERVSSLDARSLASPKPRPGENERTRRRSSTSATDVKVEHTRERLVTPPASAHRAGGRPSKAAGSRHRLPGWESSSRAAGRFDPTKRRPEGREACSARKRAPLSSTGSASIPGGGATDRCPEDRLGPAARTVRPSNEPGCLHVARNRDFHRGPSRVPPEPDEGVHFSRTRRQDPRRSPPQSARQRTRLGGSAVRPKRIACGV